MTDSPQIALAYIEKSPESAARVLSSLPPASSAAFFEEIPTSHAVSLINHLQPATAARVVQLTDDKVASAIFRELDVSKSSAVVRHMDRATRHPFLAKLPKRTRALLEKSLSFARGTVGAHMTTNAATLLQTDHVAAALDIIRQSDHDIVDMVFVLNDAGHLVGVVSSAVALRHPETTPLSAILDTTCPQLSAHSKLEVIADPALWNQFSHLPVVNRRREVIGAISRLSMTSVRVADVVGTRGFGRSMPESMLFALVTTSRGLFDLVSESVAVPASAGARDET